MGKQHNDDAGRQLPDRQGSLTEKPRYPLQS
jgi:hypothetical protein